MESEPTLSSKKETDQEKNNESGVEEKEKLIDDFLEKKEQEIKKEEMELKEELNKEDESFYSRHKKKFKKMVATAMIGFSLVAVGCEAVDDRRIFEGGSRDGEVKNEQVVDQDINSKIEKIDELIDGVKKGNVSIEESRIQINEKANQLSQSNDMISETYAKQIVEGYYRSRLVEAVNQGEINQYTLIGQSYETMEEALDNLRRGEISDEEYREIISIEAENIASLDLIDSETAKKAVVEIYEEKSELKEGEDKEVSSYTPVDRIDFKNNFSDNFEKITGESIDLKEDVTQDIAYRLVIGEIKIEDYGKILENMGLGSSETGRRIESLKTMKGAISDSEFKEDLDRGLLRSIRTMVTADMAEVVNLEK